MIDQFPHCDIAVLHAPGACAYCDARPEWQELRQGWGIQFTGVPPEAGELPCPSDFRRGIGGAHTWGGNRPTRADPATLPAESAASRWFHGWRLPAWRRTGRQ
jgi:hypothetical protein